MSIQIALLVCDTLPQAIIDFAGDYHSIFYTFLTNAAKSCGNPNFSLDSYDVENRQEYPPENTHYDAIIISGSKASAYEDVDWINRLTAYVAHIAESKPSTKLIGICFGHQIISRALGGECVPNGGTWEVGATPVHLTDIGQQIFGVPVMNLLQSHRDHVPAVPPHFHLLGSSPITPVQGMVKSNTPGTTATPSLIDVHILTVQGHPEFTSPILEVLMAKRLADGILDGPTVDDARRRADWRNDGVNVVGTTLFRMLGVSP